MIPLMHSRCREELSGDLLTGEKELTSRFGHGSPRLLRAGRSLATIAQAGDVLYRLQGGWAYRFRELSDGNRAIVDIYLAGDIMGFDLALVDGPVNNVLALTTSLVETVSGEGGLSGLMESPQTGLYIVWLLNEQQLRTDTLRAAVACLDARGRVAAMVLDLFRRLEAQAPITNSSFNLPLTQHHIACHLGLTVVHVNRVIRCLRDDGVVNIEKHCVTILDLRALEGLAKVNSRGLVANPAFPQDW
jgi:CRP/FNR family transcriptional regulator, anaerobic regulatory protein